MAPPAAAELIGDVIGEILLRLPPDEPEHLFRAALVCKLWLRVLCGPDFRRRYRAFHGTPPLLGLLHKRQGMQGSAVDRFVSTTSMPDFPRPSSNGPHGRVLIQMWAAEPTRLVFLIWDPVTGDRRVVPMPDFGWLGYTAAVSCAADSCDHLDCHGGPFRVVVVATDGRTLRVSASMYSSETGVWSTKVTLGSDCECYSQHVNDAIRGGTFVTPSRAAVIGDETYCTLEQSHAIIKYDGDNNGLSMINPPPCNAYEISLMVMDESSLGFVFIEGSKLYLWSWKVNSEVPAEWVQFRVIKLETMLPVVNLRKAPFVVGSAEGVGAIFISTDAGLFTTELKSGRVRKVDKPAVYFSVLPYMSFCTPGRILN
nr:unnamed protein product [Digitaria exilis]